LKYETKLVEFLSNLNVQPPIEDLATVLERHQADMILDLGKTRWGNWFLNQVLRILVGVRLEFQLIEKLLSNYS